jgi:hypothetical protein
MISRLQPYHSQQLIRSLAQLAVAFSFACYFDCLFAQQPILSPMDSARILIDGRRIVVYYGRPDMRGRKIMGDYVKYDKVWRTGTGPATTFVSTTDLRLGTIEIPEGSYSLYTLPSATQWKLIINKQTGQWGTVYNPDLDFGRTTLSVKRLKSPVDRLTFAFEKTNNHSGLLRIEWENTSLSVPFSVLQNAFLASPRDSTELVLGNKKISVNYGRPSRRGRAIVGVVVPYNEVWRTGANEATTFTTQADLVIGTIEVPKGRYSLYTLPSPSRWKLIINKQTGQSGTQYDRTQDLARINLTKQKVNDLVERLTISLVPKAQDSGILSLIWEHTELSVEFHLKKDSKITPDER